MFAIPIPAAAVGLAGFDGFAQAVSISPGATPLGAVLSSGIGDEVGF